jgi:K+-sensing histidine kinase KdpD
MKKVLVCITIQENSKRLIETGAKLSKELEAPLHILHIKKGDTIFDTPNSSELLDELFSYGSELGGEVHFLCSNEIPKTITEFISEKEVTNLVLGQATSPNLPSEIGCDFQEYVPHIAITCVPNLVQKTLYA